jgi:short-subunit dehydrogenase
MNKVVLITGASSELGGEIIKKFLNEKYVIYAGTREVNKIKIYHPKLHPIKLDITSDKSCIQAVKRIFKLEGRIDVLINAAGYSTAGPALDINPNDYLFLLNTNVVGAFRLIQQVVPIMKKLKQGRIINITSLCGLISLPNFGAYSSSKFAFEALGSALRYELAKDNIWVTNVAPGAIKSNNVNKISMPHKPMREKIRLLSLLMPMITPETIAQKIFKITKKNRPPASLILGIDSKISYLLHKLLPSRLWDRLQFFLLYKK